MARKSTWLAGPADYAALAYVAGVCAWLVLASPGGPITTFVGDLVFLPLGLIVGVVAWGNGRRAGERRTRLAWWLIALGAFSLWGSGAFYALFDPSLAGTEMKWWVSLLHFPLFAAGLTAFPRAPLERAARPRYWLDLTISIVAGLVLEFFVELISSVHAVQENQFARVTAAVVEWLAFVAAAHAYLRASGAVQRRVFGAWLAASVFYMAGNVGFGLVHYQPGHWVDGLWFCAWACRWIGVRSPAAMAPAPFAEPRPPAGRVRYGHSAVPYLFLAGSFGLLLWAERVGQGFLPVALGAGVMTTLLVVRHLAELRENRRLFAVQLAQEARFRSLVQQSSDVVVVLGGDGRATYVSPSVTRVFGEGSGVEVGADVSGLLLSEAGPGLRGLLERRHGAERFTALLRLPSGTRELEIVTSDLRDDTAVGGVVLNCRDVTDRNDLERQLHHAQKLEAVGQLAGGLAHEFNNLLAVIRGSAEMLAEDLRHLQVGQPQLAQIHQCVDRAAALTRKVLAFSSRQPAQASVLDLDQVIHELRPILRQLLPSGIEVTTIAGADRWRIKADQGQVEQVLINLAANARDAMPDGGRLKLRTRRHVAAGEAPGTPPREYVAVDVEDQGTGMSPEVLARAFEPFFTTKPRGQGSGLGLAMVHGLVTRADGRVDVRSEVGKGTTLTVLWPRTLEDPVAEPPIEADSLPTGEGRSVLVVDDEPGVRLFVQRALTRHGFRVVSADDGAQALEVALRETERIDVLLTDLVMPKMTGHQLATRFKAIRPDVPVVAMTGFADTAQTPEDVDGTMAAVLTKPFRIDDLLRTLDAAMAK